MMSTVTRLFAHICACSRPLARVIFCSLALVLLLTLCNPSAFAANAPVLVDETLDSIYLGDRVYYFVDTEDKFTGAGIQAAEIDPLFIQHDESIFTSPPTTRTHWFRVDIAHPAELTKRWVFSLPGSSGIRNIEVYTKSPDGTLKAVSTGLAGSATNTRLGVNDYAFTAPFETQTAETYYFRFTSFGTIKFSAYLQPVSSFLKEQALELGVVVAFCGLLLGMILLHSYEFAVTRQTHYAAFAAYMTFILLFLGNENGYSRFLPWLYPDIDVYYLRITIGAFVTGTLLLFTYLLFNIGEQPGKLRSAFHIVLATGAIMAISPYILTPLLGFYNPTLRLIMVAYIASCYALIIFSAVVALRNAVHYAGLFLVAQAIAIIGQSAQLMGIIDLINLPIASAMYGQALLSAQVILQSAAIFVKYHSTQKQLQTLQEQRLADAREENRVKSNFLSVINHELRTPLSDVLGSLEVLAKEVSASSLRWVDGARGAAEKMSKTINSILDLTDLQSGIYRSKEEIFAIDDVISDLREYCQGLCDAKGLQLQTDVLDPSVTGQLFKGDRNALQRCVSILLENAIKFTELGSVTLKVETLEDGRFRFSVTDTGIGIADATLTRIFEPFQQEDASSSRQHAGLGIGLTLCSALVTSIGGELLAESSQGHGSTFSILVGLEKAPATADKARSVTGTAVASQGPLNRRILVVDDDEMSRAILRQSLQMLGCECETADDGKAALDILSQDQNFDLILLDCHMPGMDGYTTAKSIRLNLPALRRLPLLAVTSNQSSQDKYNCFASGMNDVLEKPVPREVLRQKILLHTS